MVVVIIVYIRPLDLGKGLAVQIDVFRGYGPADVGFRYELPAEAVMIDRGYRVYRLLHSLAVAVIDVIAFRDPALYH